MYKKVFFTLVLTGFVGVGYAADDPSTDEVVEIGVGVKQYQLFGSQVTIKNTDEGDIGLGHVLGAVDVLNTTYSAQDPAEVEAIIASVSNGIPLLRDCEFICEDERILSFPGEQNVFKLLYFFMRHVACTTGFEPGTDPLTWFCLNYDRDKHFPLNEGSDLCALIGSHAAIFADSGPVTITMLDIGSMVTAVGGRMMRFHKDSESGKFKTKGRCAETDASGTKPVFVLITEDHGVGSCRCSMVLPKGMHVESVS